MVEKVEKAKYMSWKLLVDSSKKPHIYDTLYERAEGKKCL